MRLSRPYAPSKALLRRLSSNFCWTAFSALFAFFASRSLAAEEPLPLPEPSEANQILTSPPRLPQIYRWMSPGLQQKAVLVKILARVLSASDEELWKTECDKLTITGRPVSLKLVGANLAALVQFTPYLRRGVEWVLVAQGQIWIEKSETGIRYETNLKTIPVKIGEKISYFPIGASGRGGDYIEIRLELVPYKAGTETETLPPLPEKPTE